MTVGWVIPALISAAPVAAEEVASVEPPALCTAVLERLGAGESEAALIAALEGKTPIVTSALDVSDCLADAGAPLTLVAAALPGVWLDLETGSCFYTNVLFNIDGAIADVCISQHLQGLIERVHFDWRRQLAPPDTQHTLGPAVGDFYRPEREGPNRCGALYGGGESQNMGRTVFGVLSC